MDDQKIVRDSGGRRVNRPRRPFALSVSTVALGLAIVIWIMHLEMTLQMHWPNWLERSLWIFGGALIGAGLAFAI